MDTKKLRQKILDLAIRGKLVPQDPNDEPASVLLERIKAEKEQLIKEGKIKRSKKSKTTDKSHYENVPFEIPESWEWVTLGEIFNMQSGKFIEASQIYNKNDISHPYPCYGGNGLRGYVSSYNRNGSFPIIGRQGALCGNVNFTQGYFYATEHAVVVDTFTYTDEVWATYFLIQLNLNQYATATAQPGLSVKKISEVLMPLPPFQEQKRIVAEIEKWFSFIDNIKDETKELELLIKKTKSKILDLAISGKLVPQDPNDEPASELLKRINPKAEITCDNGHYENVLFEIPKSWVWTTLRDVCDVARGGSPRPIKNYLTTDDDGVNWIKIGDTDKNGKYINSTKEKIKQEGIRRSRYVHKGDFLLTNSMSFGRPYILNIDGCIHDGWLVISPASDTYVTEFLYYLLSSSFAYEQFADAASGGVVSNLNSNKVASSYFPLPPLSEQHRIVVKIEEIFERLNQIQESLEA